MWFMKIAEGFMLRSILDNWVAVPVGKNSANNCMLTLSESSAFLWKLLEKGAYGDELIEALLSRYEIDRDVAVKDVGEFLKELEKENILVTGE